MGAPSARTGGRVPARRRTRGPNDGRPKLRGRRGWLCPGRIGQLGRHARCALADPAAPRDRRRACGLGPSHRPRSRRPRLPVPRLGGAAGPPRLATPPRHPRRRPCRPRHSSGHSRGSAAPAPTCRVAPSRTRASPAPGSPQRMIALGGWLADDGVDVVAMDAEIPGGHARRSPRRWAPAASIRSPRSSRRGTGSASRCRPTPTTMRSGRASRRARASGSNTAGFVQLGLVHQRKFSSPSFSAIQSASLIQRNSAT